VKEIVVISGKGGTGKTSLAACFAVLAGRPVVADCDVDAADLHLLLAPRVLERHQFRNGHEAVIRDGDCTGCGVCREVCRFGAIRQVGSGADTPGFAVDPLSCESCGVCVRFCPAGAIDFPERVRGEWMISATRCGRLVDARLGIAAENSGRLVSLVRREARRLAEKAGCELLIVDGPPGIGCPVIASLTGADLALVVTEPTVSGEHDLERVLALARHFRIPATVCVNKWDVNAALTERIEEKARRLAGQVVGRIRYDGEVIRAQQEGRTAVEAGAPSAAEIEAIWNQVRERVESERPRRGRLIVPSLVAESQDGPEPRRMIPSDGAPSASGGRERREATCESRSR
jgi:MinD superfamily P-loop ATPase